MTQTPGAAETALRNIAEGNLGDDPWQANYDRIRAVALEALNAAASIPASAGTETEQSIDHHAYRVAHIPEPTAPTQTLGGVEPVAWRYQPVGSSAWDYRDAVPEFDQSHQWTVEPLYSGAAIRKLFAERDALSREVDAAHTTITNLRNLAERYEKRAVAAEATIPALRSPQ